jgi:hypothetical protein
MSSKYWIEKAVSRGEIVHESKGGNGVNERVKPRRG